MEHPPLVRLLGSRHLTQRTAQAASAVTANPVTKTPASDRGWRVSLLARAFGARCVTAGIFLRQRLNSPERAIVSAGRRRLPLQGRPSPKQVVAEQVVVTQVVVAQVAVAQVAGAAVTTRLLRVLPGLCARRASP